MDVVLRNLRALKSDVRRIENAVAAHDVTKPIPKVKIESLEKEIQQLKQEAKNLLRKYSAEATTDAEFEAKEPEFVAVQEKLQDFSEKLSEMKATFSTPSVAEKTVGSDEIKLPKLEMPKFSGESQDWLSFQDLFLASVHNNKKLSGAQKLQYLKGLLKDEPAKLLHHIPITDLNYDQAWTLLKSRYENRREIIKCNLDRLLSLPSLQQENPVNLRKIGDATNECVQALDILKINPEQARDSIIIHVITKKLDGESRLEWEKSLKPDSLPTIKEFTEFIVQQARVTAAASVKTKNTTVSKPKENSDSKFTTTVHYGTKNEDSQNCRLCEKSKHYLNHCEDYKKMSRQEKTDYLKKNNRCFNCLEFGHRSSECKSKYSCKKCDDRHHTSIHINRDNSTKKISEEIAQKAPERKSEEKSSSSHLSSLVGSRGASHTLLATALVKVVNRQNESVVCRALLDNGSQTSFISKKLATRLGLKLKPSSLPISGLGGTSINTEKYQVNLDFGSIYSSEKVFRVRAQVMSNVTGIHPSFKIDYDNWTHIKGLQLADPKFHEPGNIDILLGGDIYEDLVKIKKRKVPEGTPYVRDTVLGWILVGAHEQAHPPQQTTVYHSACSLNENLNRFWELENIPEERLLTKEDKMCEDHFATTHARDQDGRYVVRLPFKENRKIIGESRHLALKRLQSMERRFQNQPEKMKEYNDIIQEYLDMGHMEKVPAAELSPKKEVYYLPHHAVYKPSSTTTKVRVVFDASAKSASGVSLNETLLTGPRLQDDLIAILFRFRQHKIVLVGDIAKMYRQIKMNNEDADFQRIVWRRSTKDPVEEYRLTTVTFGTASAPYQAIKVVQQLAEDEKQKYPEASEIIKRDLYVDDLMSGSSTIENALQLQEDLIKILNLGGFQLRKWSSNSTKILEAVSPEMRETKLPMKIDVDNSIKTLGLLWSPTTDQFSFTVNISSTENLTKRKVLSEMAKIFDPLGLLSPVTVKAKMFIQNLWKSNLDWDDQLNDDDKEYWKSYVKELPQIENIKIPRFYGMESESYFELLGFCDASEKAYAACVYLKSTDSNENVTTTLIAAKTKVAPVKQITLARLELCGAVLLSRLMKSICSALTINIKKIYACTDSTIVLGWIGSPSQRWKTFVSHRVSEIQETLPIENWCHIAGQDNPADCASRGIRPSELEGHNLWWHGPQNLQNKDMDFPDSQDLLSEEKTVTKNVFLVQEVAGEDRPRTLLFKISSWEKLQRIFASMLRFLHNARYPNEKLSGAFSVFELNEALRYIVKKAQSEEFKTELENIKQKKPLPRNKEKIRNLNPFIDQDGIMRVGGRLFNANVSFDKKHPMLLPKNHPVTEMIIRYYHTKLLHGGSQLLLSDLQEKFWIPSGRDVVRKLIRRCVICVRLRAETAQQMMGSLPQARVNPSRPFLHSGVDFAGPFTLKNARGRNPIKYKAYVALFICMSTRAIHLEPVSDLTTETFLQTLKRFVSTRGKPTEMYSDCGTNFVGADRELKASLKLFNEENSQNYLKIHAAKEGITWKFNAPTGAHFGGLWEAGVKSMKFHLKRVIGLQLLNFEELLTILKQIEACLNSRPLCPLSTDPNDDAALTPGHFLIGSALTAIPEPNLTSLQQNRLSRWQLVQKMFQQFWKRWSGEHLSRLQQRPKWLAEKPNLGIGNLVLIKDDQLPPLHWKMGRITEVFPGNDGCVRVVNVKTSDGILKRPIVKLCHLPVD